MSWCLVKHDENFIFTSLSIVTFVILSIASDDIFTLLCSAYIIELRSPDITLSVFKNEYHKFIYAHQYSVIRFESDCSSQ